jgi:hypothetical protein
MNSSSGEIITRIAEKSDIPFIIEGWKTAYNKTFKYKYPERWNWLFEENPFILNSKNFLPIWISTQNGKVIGWTCSMITMIEINQQIFSVDMGVDTYIFKNYRKKGLALKLYSHVMANESQPAHFSIQSAPSVIKVKCDLGGRLGIPFCVYYKLIGDFDPELLYNTFLSSIRKKFYKKLVDILICLKKFGAHRILSKILSILFKAIQSKYAKKGNMHSSELRFQKVEVFGEEVDQLWDRCRNRFKLSIRRDSKYLNWKFVNQPYLNYQKYLIYKEGKIYGVLIFRIGEPPEIPVGVITELYTDDDDSKDFFSILRYAENELTRKGATMIRCGTCESALKKCLESLSFRKILVEIPVVRLPEGINDDIFKGPWLMSMGDHDIDIPLLNNQPGFSDIVQLLLGKTKVKYLNKITRP